MKQNHHELKEIYRPRSMAKLKNCIYFCQLDVNHPEAEHNSPTPPLIPTETTQKL
jgi:hypothetical protein